MWSLNDVKKKNHFRHRFCLFHFSQRLKLVKSAKKHIGNVIFFNSDVLAVSVFFVIQNGERITPGSVIESIQNSNTLSSPVLRSSFAHGPSVA